MRPAPLPVLQGTTQRGGRDLAPLTREADQLQPAAEKFRRAAFVDGDVRLRVAQHRAPRRRKVSDRKRIGGGTGRHQEDRAVALENLRDPRLDAPRRIVIPVPERKAFVGLADRLQDGGRDARGVVACEIHDGPDRY